MIQKSLMALFVFLLPSIAISADPTAQDYTDALKSISLLLNESENILEYLADENNEVSGFATIQVNEERIKAILLLKNDSWRREIIDIENHTYFYGQIGFLLNFCAIDEYYKENELP